MAHHKDAIKRIRTSEEARKRNKHYRSRMRNEIKAMREALADGDLETAQSLLSSTVSAIQRTAQKGVIHRRQAARRVQRLQLQLNALSRGENS